MRGPSNGDRSSLLSPIAADKKFAWRMISKIDFLINVQCIELIPIRVGGLKHVIQKE